MKRTLALGGVAAGLLASAAIAAPAHADQIPSINLAKTNFAAKEIAAFWYGEARANLIKATPYGVETKISAKHVSTGGVSADDKAGTVGSSGDQKAATGNTKNVNLPKTTGKVFFIGADHQPHWCSATSVQSQYKNLVATAGHCVYDTKSNATTLDKWVFIPGYYQGKTPWGIYVGKTAYTHYDYSVYEDGDRDYAFVTVYNGVQVTDVSYDRRGRYDHGRYDDRYDHGRHDKYDGRDHDGRYRGGRDHDDRRSFVRNVSVREFQALNRGRDLTGNGPWAKGTGAETNEINERAYRSNSDSYVSRDGKTLYFRKKVWGGDDEHHGPGRPGNGGHGHGGWGKGDDDRKLAPLAEPSSSPSASPSASPSTEAFAAQTSAPTPEFGKRHDDRGHDWCDDHGDRFSRGHDRCDDNGHRPKYKYYARTFWAKSVRHDDHRPHGTLKITLKDVGTLGSNVGGQGLAYNQKIGTAVFQFGYPSGSHPDGNYAFTGQTLKWAYGKTFKASSAAIKGEELVGLKSSFTGEGAIGSSWLYRYSSTKRLGYLNGVTIGLADTDGNGRIDTSISPYFDGETLAVYKQAAANWSGKIV
ncbi:hypothetical protein AB0O28_27360 [Microbispora sp. NPDC088329]|uniref:trypsin-like serine peptidase n=1 Tax=Microbispora sp. NPDC088329 TaxID=3154869 RepID=UPI00342BD49F